MWWFYCCLHYNNKLTICVFCTVLVRHKYQSRLWTATWVFSLFWMFYRPNNKLSNWENNQKIRKWENKSVATLLEPWMPRITSHLAALCTKSTCWVCLFLCHRSYCCLALTGLTASTGTDGASVQQSDVTGKQQSLVWISRNSHVDPLIEMNVYITHTHTRTHTESKSFYLIDRNNRWKLHPLW